MRLSNNDIDLVIVYAVTDDFDADEYQSSKAVQTALTSSAEVSC